MATTRELRELAQDHDLSDELDRAIVVPSERMPRDVVTMHSRCIYIDENVGVQRETNWSLPRWKPIRPKARFRYWHRSAPPCWDCRQASRSTGNFPVDGSAACGSCASCTNRTRQPTLRLPANELVPDRKTGGSKWHTSSLGASTGEGEIDRLLAAGLTPVLDDLVRRFEAIAIDRALAFTGGNRSYAAPSGHGPEHDHS